MCNISKFAVLNMRLQQEINVFEKLIKKVAEKGYTVDLGTMPIEMAIKYKVYYKFIFDHDFQMALWGDAHLDKDKKPLVFTGEKLAVNPNAYKYAWQWYAMDLAIQKDYLQYLKKFV